MKKYFQLLSVAVLGIAIPLLALETNLQDLALRLGEVAGHLGGAGKPDEPEVLPVYTPKPEYAKLATVVIDVQHDFMDMPFAGKEKGSLAVAGTGGQYPVAVKALNDYLRGKLGAIFQTQDWHPAGHVSFHTSWLNRATGEQLAPFIPVGEQVKLLGGIAPDPSFCGAAEMAAKGLETASTVLKLTQVLWPAHCVQGTPGAEIFPGLFVDGTDILVRKGTRCFHDSYSGVKDEGEEATILVPVLQAADVKDVIVYGIATDYCVFETATHLLEAGFRVHLVVNASRGVAQDSIIANLKKLRTQGGNLYWIDDLNDGLNKAETLAAFDKGGLTGIIDVATKDAFLTKVASASKPALAEVVAAEKEKTFANVKEALAYFETVAALTGIPGNDAVLVTPLVKVPAEGHNALVELIGAYKDAGLLFPDYNQLRAYISNNVPADSELAKKIAGKLDEGTLKLEGGAAELIIGPIGKID